MFVTPKTLCPLPCATPPTYIGRLEKEAGIQAVFVIVSHVENGDPFRVAQDIGNKYGIGNKKTDRGLVIVVAVDDRKYFIAPGDGLEGDLTDVECDDIARSCIVKKYAKEQSRYGYAIHGKGYL